MGHMSILINSHLEISAKGGTAEFGGVHINVGKRLKNT